MAEAAAAAAVVSNYADEYGYDEEEDGDWEEEEDAEAEESETAEGFPRMPLRFSWLQPACNRCTLRHSQLLRLLVRLPPPPHLTALSCSPSRYVCGNI